MSTRVGAVRRPVSNARARCAQARSNSSRKWTPTERLPLSLPHRVADVTATCRVQCSADDAPMAKRMRVARKSVGVPKRDLVGSHPALCHACHPTYTLKPVCVPPVCSQPLHESLQVNEILHGVTERRPSECTRHALGVSLFSPPPPLPIDYVWEGSHHRLLEALTCALSASRHPRVMRLADAAPDSDAVRRSWEQHLCVCERTCMRTCARTHAHVCTNGTVFHHLTLTLAIVVVVE